MFEKLINGVSIPFKKLKVFNQILIIAGVMFVFLALEGIMGIYTIETLNKFSRNTFNDGFQLMFRINDFQKNFQKLQTNYLQDIFVNGSSAAEGFKDDQDKIKREINQLKEANLENVNNLENEITTMNRILEKPANQDNYRELEMSLSNIKYSLENVNGRVRLLAMISMDQGERYSNMAKLITLILLLMGTGLAVLLSLAIAIPIAKPLKSVKITANSLSDGDLTKTIPAEGSLEVVTVVDSLNKAIVGLRKLVGGIHNQSNTLYSASQDLKNASKETGRSATEVAKAMEELARASTEQASETSEAVENINRLSDLVRQVSGELKNISAESEGVAQSAKLGQKATNNVAEAIAKIYGMTKEVTANIDELNKTSVQIAEITSLIQGIAEQTSLLALNAAIEAARAGEHGKGFAVVAAETGKLADESKQAAQLISDLIDQVKSCSEKAVLSVTNGMNVVESGKSLVSDATVTFEDIFNKLGGILARIDSVTLSAKRMADSNEGMISAISNIAALSEESVASTEEVSAIAEEQNVLVEQVNALAENLIEISSELKKSVSQFRIHSSNEGEHTV
jgi:methyl-accepting chemotaxis protein